MVVKKGNKMREKMYATCLNNTGANKLEKNKEYRIIRLTTYVASGEDCLYVLEDGLEYSSCHFSATYLK
jgi:hypothetical protein